MLPRQWAQYWGHIGSSCFFINSKTLSAHRRGSSQYWTSIRATHVRLLGRKLFSPGETLGQTNWYVIFERRTIIDNIKNVFRRIYLNKRAIWTWILERKSTRQTYLKTVLGSWYLVEKHTWLGLGSVTVIFGPSLDQNWQPRYFIKWCGLIELFSNF